MSVTFYQSLDFWDQQIHKITYGYCHENLNDEIPIEIAYIVLIFLIQTQSPSFSKAIYGDSLQINTQNASVCKCTRSSSKLYHHWRVLINCGNKIRRTCPDLVIGIIPNDDKILDKIKDTSFVEIEWNQKGQWIKHCDQRHGILLRNLLKNTGAKLFKF